MIFSNILLTLVIVFFCIHLILAIREGMNKHKKIHLISSKTGRVVELDATKMADFINKEVLSDFTNIAKAMFKCVSESFAKGKLTDAKKYLGEQVFPVFQKAISEREALHQTTEFVLIGFKDVKILEDSPVKKVVSFTTEQINLLKDENNNVIEGDPLYVATVTEDWTFTRKKEEDSWVVNAIESKEAHFA